ncbi:Endoplasmic reticulum metallopeptidase 1 [Desmophyllum pertusum]|uniref:Endoplasmic reticulum metallopeptidase 1 n=1 Tax=Desmophyllum pertusum TaxID=174260 RepID=A0A9X0CDN4_9CNID|nr:Endoplasmic reticulum metallopeptidase 1 [Desmophyllum pertusum]
MAVPMAVAALLTYTGHSLTWYCRPYLLLALYAAPSMFGVGFVHFLARRSLVSKRKAVIEKDKHAYSVEDEMTSRLAVRENRDFLRIFTSLDNHPVNNDFCMYVTIAVMDVFVPIMGRGGTQTPPDIFIALLCSLAVVMVTSYVV